MQLRAVKVSSNVYCNEGEDQVCAYQMYTPFVVTADGALGVDGKAFMHLLSENIAATWHKSNSEVMGYVRARLMFAILRATNLCIHGSQ